MCGIAGLVLGLGVDVGQHLDAIKRMTDRMRPRGPDAEGAWSSDGIVLGHRRLAILDLDARANQPMVSADGRYAIVFNGEIYNYRDLRREFEDSGVVFRTGSDTEVLLALFAREGAAMLPRLRGMFAFGIWDAHSREMFLARDAYGIKPLYYTNTSSGLLYASQVKALLASGLVSANRESAGLAGFYLWGSVPEPWTLYRGVFALPAGHWMRVRGGNASSPVCWHDISLHWRGQGVKLSAKPRQDLVRQAVMDSVRAHLVSDVPVSVFLSGGIDSAVIAGLASEAGATVEGITIEFEEFIGHHDDEVPTAKAIAEHYGFSHFVRRISSAEFEEDFSKLFDAMDQPSIDGVNTWFASKAAAERSYKVVLSGVGGDELFCGYSTFKSIPLAAKLGRVVSSIPFASEMLVAPANWLAKWRSNPKFVGLPAFMDSFAGMYFLNRGLFLPEELPALMGPDMALEGLARLGGSPPGMTPADAGESCAAVGLLESTLYLRNQLLHDSDWASMGHSLELRTPLVDAKLLETLGPYVSGFAGGVGKAMLARSLAKPLPDFILNRSKTGFSLPMGQWLSAERITPGSPLAASEGPWARRWAKTVIEAMT